MTRKRLRLAGIVVAAVIVYTAAIAVMFEGNRSGLAILAMLGVAITAVIAVRVRFLVRIVLLFGIIIYTFGVTVATNVATGRGADFLGCTSANWDELIYGEACP